MADKNPFQKIASFVKKIADAANIPILPDLLDLLDGNDDALAKLSPEQRMAYEQAKLEYDYKMRELATQELKAEIDEVKSLRELAREEIKSDDPFVRRVRPGILAGLAIFVLGFWGVAVPLLNSIWNLSISPAALSALPSELWMAFIFSYLGYGAYRSFDKRTTQNGNGKHAVPPLR